MLLSGRTPRLSTLRHVMQRMTDESYASEYIGLIKREQEFDNMPYYKLWANFYKGMHIPPFKELFEHSGLLIFDFTFKTAIFFEDFIFEVLLQFKDEPNKEILFDALNKNQRSPLQNFDSKILGECIDSTCDLDQLAKLVYQLFLLEFPAIYTASLEIDLDSLYLTEKSRLRADNIRAFIPQKRLGKPGECYHSYFCWLNDMLKEAPGDTLSKKLKVDDDQLRRWKNPSSKRQYVSNSSMRRIIMDLDIPEFEKWNYFIYYLWAKFIQRHIDEINKMKLKYTYGVNSLKQSGSEVDWWKKRLQEIIPQPSE